MSEAYRHFVLKLLLPALLMAGNSMRIWGQGQNLIPNSSLEYASNIIRLDTQLSSGLLCWDAPNGIEGLVLSQRIVDTNDVSSTVVYQSVFQGARSGTNRIVLFQYYALYTGGVQDTSLPDTRSYARVKLKEPLDSGKDYTLLLRVSAGFRVRGCLSQHEAYLQNFGVCFDSTRVAYPKGKPILRNPDIRLNTENLFTDFRTWNTLQLQYRANGKERYLLLGNFDPVDSFVYPYSLSDLGSCLTQNFSLMHTMAIDDLVLTEDGAGSFPDTTYLNTARDTLLCDTSAFPYAVRIKGDYDSLVWQDGSSSDSFEIPGPGTYGYSVYLACGVAADSVLIETETADLLDFVRDTTICSDSEVMYDSGIEWKPYYTWSGGDTGSVLHVTRNDTFILEQHKYCRTYSDTLRVTLHPPPPGNYMLDTLFCLNAADSFHLPESNTYRWRSVSTNDTLYLPGPVVVAPDSLRKQSSFVYKIDDGTCLGPENTIYVFMDSLPHFTLLDSFACPDWEVWIGPSEPWNYSWSDGGNVSPRLFDTSGRYTLTASNSCGTHTDSLEFRYLLCDSKLENCFTPNGDGLNDYFNPQIYPYERVSMEIFNRWGERVYLEGAGGQGWNGRFRDKPALPGPYLYFITYQYPGGEELKLHGWVRVLR